LHADRLAVRQAAVRSAAALSAEEDPAWRGELTQRVQAYHARRRKVAPNGAQSQFPFGETAAKPPAQRSVAVAEAPQHTEVQNPSAAPEEEFSFTIAIGRPAKKREPDETRMVIDVSMPPESDPASPQSAAPQVSTTHSGLYPAASLDERRLAALIDAGCLFFAYGGFLTLFGSLGGHFTLSKLSAAVYFATFAFVYLQYFGLFTIFGGTTPGMMLRGLQVVNFSGETPSPRQMLLRAAGYILSAGTFFLGFLWALWDEDALTWHDRLSHTYLSSAETMTDADGFAVTHE
jgi:uncharacterized RDD family membrane protein YckC